VNGVAHPVFASARRHLRGLLLAAFASVAGLTGANVLADSRIPVPTTPLPAYQAECGSCHMAFEPAFMPAASWQRVMAGLNKHYGADASLDAATTQAISTWVQANAGGYRRVREEPPHNRITESDWFVRKHREVAGSVWTRPAIKSPGNCPACHLSADRGNYNERNVRIPK
jgi:Dihaem cytochrome c